MHNDPVGEAITARQALEEIARIEGLHEALARRTTGLTWMIWGIIAPAIFVTYSLAAAAIALGVPIEFLYPILWIPWALIGLATSASLWRSAGLVVPVERVRSLREGLLTGLLIVGVVGGGMTLLLTTGFPLAELAVALLGLGVGTTVAGLLGLNSIDATGRRLWIFGGLILVATAVGGSLILGANLVLSEWGFIVIAPLASALVFFGGGWYLTTRA